MILGEFDAGIFVYSPELGVTLSNPGVFVFATGYIDEVKVVLRVGLGITFVEYYVNR